MRKKGGFFWPSQTKANAGGQAAATLPTLYERWAAEEQAEILALEHPGIMIRDAQRSV